MRFYLFFVVTVLISCVLCKVEYNLGSHYHGNSKVGELILNMIDREASPHSKINEYKQFLDEMIQYDGMYSIAGTILGYQVHQLIRNLGEDEQLYSIKSKLITEIKEVPWNMTITLYNIAFRKYLCSSDEKHATEPSYYKVYTLRNLDENCYWSFNVEANGGYFAIQNKANDRYLFAAANKFDLDQERRTIYTIANTSSVVYSSDKWQLQPMRSTRAKNLLQYRIKNLFWDEYIYNFDDNSMDREVLAWKPLGCDGDACRWNIATAPNELPIERQLTLSKYYDQYYGNHHVALLLLGLASNSPTQIREYRNLYDLMSRNDGLYSVAAMSLDYNVYKLLKEKPYDPDLLYIEENFRKLWKKIPWQNRILIKNLKYNRFLCPSSEIFKNTSYIMGYTLSDSSSCQWKIEVDPSRVRFRIKSIANGGYLLAATNEYNFDSSRRRVFIANSREKIVADTETWLFEHARRPDLLVRIKSFFWDEFLYNLNDGKLDRDLMTWRPFGCDGDACLWRIIDADAK